MGAIYKGTTLKNFSGVQENTLESVTYYISELKGQTTEGFVSSILSFFQCVVMRVESGSPLDKQGVDILVRGSGHSSVSPFECTTLGLQVKSSEFYFDEFLSHPSGYYENLIVLWVDIQSWQSRRALFMGLFPILKANGINLKPEIVEVIKKRDMFFKKGIRVLPNQKGTYAGFSKDDIHILTALGISHIHKGDLMI
jgi:hypothetical protein